MPAFNIENTTFNTKCGIKEWDIRNIIEDIFPVADEISFQDVAVKIRDKLANLGYYFSVYVSELYLYKFHTYCGISIGYNNLIEYYVKYNGKAPFLGDSRNTTGRKYLVMIWN